MTTEDTWLTTDQAARRLRITKQKLRYLIAMGRLPAEKTPAGPLRIAERWLARYERDAATSAAEGGKL